MKLTTAAAMGFVVVAPACLLLADPLMYAEGAQTCGQGDWWDSASDIGSATGVVGFDTPDPVVKAFCGDTTGSFGAVKWTAPADGVWSFVVKEGIVGVGTSGGCTCVDASTAGWSGRVEQELKADEVVYMLLGPVSGNDTGDYIGASTSLAIYQCRDATSESGPTASVTGEVTSFAWDGPLAKSLGVVDEAGTSMWNLQCAEDAETGVGVDCVSWPLTYGGEVDGAEGTMATPLVAGTNYTLRLSYSCWDGEGQSGLGADDIYELEFPFTL